MYQLKCREDHVVDEVILEMYLLSLIDRSYQLTLRKLISRPRLHSEYIPNHCFFRLFVFR
jgi:hypothetical protein